MASGYRGILTRNSSIKDRVINESIDRHSNEIFTVDKLCIGSLDKGTCPNSKRRVKNSCAPHQPLNFCLKPVLHRNQGRFKPSPQLK